MRVCLCCEEQLRAFRLVVVARSMQRRSAELIGDIHMTNLRQFSYLLRAAHDGGFKQLKFVS